MIAKVAFPIAMPGIFDYTIPDKFRSRIVPGVPVRVELRSRSIWGVVVEVAEKSAYPDLKEILEVKSKHWTNSSRTIIKLYEWISAYYQSDLSKVFKPLIRKRFAEMSPKTVTIYKYSGNTQVALTKKQRDAVDYLKVIKGEITRSQLLKKYSVSAHIISSLISKGILIKSKKQILREASELHQRVIEDPVNLTGEQKRAVEIFWTHSSKIRKPFLLYGITGSGKTHVYIELVKKTLDAGKGVIIMVPEISLTPQTIQRFRDSVGSEIAVIHSRMSDGERRDSIEEIVSGRKRIVIGVRSAILVPMDNVGLILVDEEHDGSYKQSEPEPRYNARDVAVMRGYFQKAIVVLGSATPSFESYYNALSGKYTLVKLVKRFGEAALPQVKIIDMNQEHKENNWTFLSRYLQERIKKILDNKRQIILLLNRRGFSVTLICKDCGHIYECPNCSVNLVYHRFTMSLKCHQCGYGEPAPTACSKCGGEQIKYKGTGIQKVEEFLGSVFPQARIIRMDLDTTRRKGKHISILETFTRREADILLGTQMVAKGLNFPGVRLVGVLQADIGLHFPDFRASEKTFQLLTQVAGRAGRKDSLGEVVIQTYSPKEAGIICAKEHDFEAFYQEEIKDRRALRYPPFSRLARIIIQGEAEALVKSNIKTVAKTVNNIGGDVLTVLGPSPAVLARLKKVYRYSILIKSRSPKKLQNILSYVRRRYNKLPKSMKLVVDVDPINML